MSGTTRTFVAVEMPGPVQAELQRLQDRLTPEAPGIRWIKQSTGFHLTLAFLGNVPDSDLAAVGRAVQDAAEPFGPLGLRIEGLGAFPKPARPRVVWAGLGGPGVAGLGELRYAIVKALAEVGHAPADDRFSPHVTIGRHKEGRGRSPDLTGPLGRLGGVQGPPFEVGEVIVFASKPGPAGPAYTPLAHAPLKGQKPPIRP
jgi:2'-5' RNA ligase